MFCVEMHDNNWFESCVPRLIKFNLWKAIIAFSIKLTMVISTRSSGSSNNGKEDTPSSNAAKTSGSRLMTQQKVVRSVETVNDFSMRRAAEFRSKICSHQLHIFIR